MLGITVPDSVALGTLFIAILAAWRGAQLGNAAKHSPIEPAAAIGAGVADGAGIQALAQAVIELSGVIRTASINAVQSKEDETNQLLKRMLEELQHRNGGERWPR